MPPTGHPYLTESHMARPSHHKGPAVGGHHTSWEVNHVLLSDTLTNVESGGGGRYDSLQSSYPLRQVFVGQMSKFNNKGVLHFEV